MIDEIWIIYVIVKEVYELIWIVNWLNRVIWMNWYWILNIGIIDRIEYESIDMSVCNKERFKNSWIESIDKEESE